ncbi:MAG: DUF488 domain-containing protein [Dehalococcoidia bacterium]
MLNTYKPLNLPSKSASVQLRDRDQWNLTRSKFDADFYTIGYSGRKVLEFIGILKSVKICSVVDIRFSPTSMYRPEFNKSNLLPILKRHNISYFHQPELGIPRDIRGMALDTNSRDVLWEWYDRYIVGNYINGNLDNFFNSSIHPIAFLCLEVSPLECHRHRLALALERKGLRSYDL